MNTSIFASPALATAFRYALLFLLGCTTSARAFVLMDANVTPKTYQRNDWTLKKTGTFTPTPGGGPGTATWTVTVEPGQQTAGLVLYGHFEFTNVSDVPASIRNVVVNLQTKPGANWTTLSSNVADSITGDAATSASVEPSLTEEGLSTFTENALSDTLTLTNAANNTQLG